MPNYFSKFPLLRFLFPVVFGIILAKNSLDISVILAITLFVFIVCVLLKKYLKLWDKELFVFVIILNISFFDCRIQYSSPQLVPLNNKVYFRVDDCHYRDSNTKYIGKIISIDSDKETLWDAIIYIDGNNYNIKPGTLISFKSDFKKIENLGNPCEFDYSGYLENKGISYTQNLKRDDYVIVGESITVFNYATRIRNYLIKKILKSDLSVDSQNFLIAILLGDKQFLDQDIKDSFSNIGIAHILALSGLHVGVIGFIIYLLLFPLDYIGARRFRLSLSIIILLAYVFVSGCSPSVMRAFLMYLLWSISLLIYRKDNILNSIILSFIIILFISPYQLFDIGFQFSYLAVVSIILFTPRLNPLSRNNLFYNTVNYFMVSVSAMLGTGVLAAYYFNVAPLMFIVPNLLIVPLLPLLLFLGILILINDIYLFDSFFDFLYDTIIYIVDCVNSISVSSTSVSINQEQMFFAYIIIIGIFLLLKLWHIKVWRWITACGIFIFTILIFVFNDTNKNFHIIVFNDYKDTPILVHDNGEYVFAPVIEEPFLKSFKSNNRKFISEYSIDDIKIGNQFKQFNEGLIYSFTNKDKTFVILDSSLPKLDTSSEKRCTVDYIIVTKNCYSSMRRILETFNTHSIIISGNIFEDRRKKLIDECITKKINFHDLHSQGAFVLD